MIYPQDSRGHLQKHTDIDTALAGALSLTTLATTDADPTSAFRVQQDARLSATIGQVAVPRWATATAYEAGAKVVSPNGDIVTAVTAHTSTTFAPANWTLSATFATKWQTATVYAAGAQVISPLGLVVSSVAAHTSTTYNPANWTIPIEVAGLLFPENFGAVGDGTTDDTNAMQAALQAAYNAGGGTISLSQSKTYRCNGQITIPNDGLSFPGGRYIRITGNGYDGALYPSGAGAKLDLRYAGANAKILALARGVLELDHFTLTDNGTSSTPFLLTTNTILNVHDMSVLGNSSKTGVTCDQDVFVFGGTVAVAGGLVTSGFQGYGSRVTRVQFGRIRRAVYLRVWANSLVVRDNSITSSCGANGTQAAIELDPTADAAGMAWGNVISGNLIEVSSYTRGVLCIGASRNMFENNSFWDQGAGFVGDYNFTNGSIENHVVTGGPSSKSANHIVEDASSIYGNGVEGIFASGSLPGLGLSGRINIGSRTPNARVRVDAPILLGGTSSDGLATGVTIQSQAVTPESSGTRLLSCKNHPAGATNPGGEVLRLNNDGTLILNGPSGGNFQNGTFLINNIGLSRYTGSNITIDGGASGTVIMKRNGLQLNGDGGGVVQYSGAGAPVLAATLGDAYWRKDGGAMTWLYRCTTAGVAAAASWTAVL
jgi:hypothetical protein